MRQLLPAAALIAADGGDLRLFEVRTQASGALQAMAQGSNIGPLQNEGRTYLANPVGGLHITA
jgi:hypothetical protein